MGGGGEFIKRIQFSFHPHYSMSRHWSFTKGLRLDLTDDWMENEEEKVKTSESQKENGKEGENEEEKENCSMWRKKLEWKAKKRIDEGTGRVQMKEKEGDVKKTDSDDGQKKGVVIKTGSLEKERKEVIEPLTGGEESARELYY